MSSLRLCIVGWVLLGISVYNGFCCGPAQIGQRYTLSPKQVSYSGNVTWYASNSLVYDSGSTKPNKSPSEYSGSRTSLTILNVQKIHGSSTYEYRVNGSAVDSCYLYVYKRATTPSCENLTLTGNQIGTKCTTAQVYPKAKCHFTLTNGVIDEKIISHEKSYIKYNHSSPPSGLNEYYSTSCTLEYPVNGFKPGDWRVRVSMYPDLTGVSLAQGTTGNRSGSLTLSVPTVSIDDKKCPLGLAEEGNTHVRNGYIRQGQRASCLCSLAHQGMPTGTVGWSSRGGDFLILSQTELMATIQINSPGTFICKSKSVLDGSDSREYSPKYAYIPSSASLTFQPPAPIYLCPNQQPIVEITCQVQANSFNPALLFIIRDGDNNTLVTKAAGDTALNTSVNYNFTKFGVYTFSCQVENTIFSDMFIESPASAIQVYEPPRNYPNISARSSQNGDIFVEGDDVIVTCEVEGGYPSVQSVTLTCGHDQPVTSQWTSVGSALTFIEMRYNYTNCTCQATHVTRCYDLVDVLPLIVIPNEKEDGNLFTAAELTGGIIGTFLTLCLLLAAIALIAFYFRRKSTYQKAKEEHTYTNQSFGNDTEPVEPDPNAYSDIQAE